MLDIKNLSVTYEDKQAVRDVTLSIEPGKITGLIGPNGAGKSSLIKACVGLINEYAGSISFDGHDRTREQLWIKKHCGFAPEDTELLPYLRGTEFLQLIGTIRKERELISAIDFFLNLFGLESKKDELILNYSHGMRQKISIAAALIGRPQFIILDEALNGLDPISLFRLKNYFRELISDGRTILLSSHILSLIRQWCDPVIVMHEGKIIGQFSSGQIRTLEQEKNKDFDEIFVDLVAAGQN